MNKKSASALKVNTPSTFNERLIRSYSLFISLFFLASVPIAVIYTQEWDFFQNLWTILTSPSKLVTDYFALGGLGSTLFNAAICGLAIGFKYGIIVGMLSATICSVTSSMHGGFVLYNGGFTAGLTALIMIPLLDYYNIKPKQEDDI